MDEPRNLPLQDDDDRDSGYEEVGSDIDPDEMAEQQPTNPNRAFAKGDQGKEVFESWNSS